MYTVSALLCFVVVIHWLIFPYPSGLLRWHCGNLTIAPVPAKQHWWIWINTSCEFIMNDYITTAKQSTTKPCAYFLGYTVSLLGLMLILVTKKGPRNMTQLVSVRFSSHMLRGAHSLVIISYISELEQNIKHHPHYVEFNNYLLLIKCTIIFRYILYLDTPLPTQWCSCLWIPFGVIGWLQEINKIIIPGGC